MTNPHKCPNCEGIDPDTCLTNPDRPQSGGPQISARERLEAYMTHESDADADEYGRRLDAYRAEVLREAEAKLRERAGELSELAEETLSRALEEQAQEWHRAADVVGRMAKRPATAAS